MYDRHLDAFIKVVELGSFSKAARELFVSANALMKQVNLLEREVGVPLLVRTHAGVRTTEAGEGFYQDALAMVELARDAVARARAAGGSTQSVVRLGTSILRPAATVGRLWWDVAWEHPGVRLEVVITPDDMDRWMHLAQHLGETIDVELTITPSGELATELGCVVRELYTSPLCVQVPRTHPLAGRERLTVEDLHGQHVSMAAAGITPYVDSLRAYLAAEHPQVTPDDRPPFDLGEFNRCAAEGELLLSCREWDDVHPGMVNKEVDWGEWGDSIGFSLIFSTKPAPAVAEFVEAVCARAREERGDGD